MKVFRAVCFALALVVCCAPVAMGEGFALTSKGTRLSVMPVTAAQWKLLVSLE